MVENRSTETLFDSLDIMSAFKFYFANYGRYL